MMINILRAASMCSIFLHISTCLELELESVTESVTEFVGGEVTELFTETEKVTESSSNPSSNEDLPSELAIRWGGGNEASSEETETTLHFKKFENYTITSVFDEVLPGITSFSLYWEKFEAPYEIQKDYPYYHSGYDDDSRPVWISEVGKWNVRRMIEAGGETLKAFDRYTIQSLYRMDQSILEISTRDSPVTGVVGILDAEGFDLDQLSHVPTISYMITFLRKYLTLMNQFLHRGFIINTNAFAHSLINLLKPFSGNVFEKIEIHGTNRCKIHPLPFEKNSTQFATSLVRREKGLQTCHRIRLNGGDYLVK